MKHLSRLFIILALVMGLALPAAADTVDKIVKRGELRVAVQTQGPPFSFVDKNGERTGSSVELCRLIAKEMGVKIKFLDYDWDGLIPALLSRKADMLAADMTATLKRALKVSFTDPFYVSKSVVFTKRENAGKYQTLEDCNKAGVRTAVLLGSTGETDAKRLLANTEIKPYKGGGPLLINAVISGKADIGVNDLSAIRGQMQNFPEGSIAILPIALSAQPLSFAVRPEDTHLRQWLNLFFLWIRSDGRLKQNLDYWVNSNRWRQDH
ncbi:MAG: amino acid ABC transporter substrate-binding protein [Deltaproteobacteria bacterium]|nr:amino acid ABC transporter substrate-binding protein [Deltaproteobacteria bacterium]MBW2071489.1 amino acid ABC transporter substrate-binding protein [Deltaproteobacteria bacterium]